VNHLDFSHAPGTSGVSDRPDTEHDCLTRRWLLAFLGRLPPLIRIELRHIAVQIQSLAHVARIGGACDSQSGRWRLRL